MTKSCTSCDREKSVSLFARNKRTRDGYCSWCKECHAKQSLDYYRRNREKVAKYASARAKLPEVKARRRVIQKRYAKKHPERVAASNKAWRESNRVKVKEQLYNNWLKRNYGITRIEYEELLRSQDGRCAICRTLPTTQRRLAVDHDHDTGKIRGILCDQCNVGLGNFRESAAMLKAAAVYIRGQATRRVA
jgi:hypothetical protein